VISVTPKKIRYIDHIAINSYGIASITLMENAGSRIKDVAKDILRNLKNKRVCVVCGKGNNGGDGIVVSRHLINSGFEVDIFLLAKISHLKGDAKFNLALLRSGTSSIKEITKTADLIKFFNNFNYGLVVDGIFGTGFSGSTIPEPIKSLIAFLNSSKCKIISIDIPSGLDGLSGRKAEVTVKADTTVTLGLPKKGFYCCNGPKHTGRVLVKNIGFPKSLLCK